MSTLEIPSELSHNQRLLDYVRPAEWQNPTPNGRYNFVVIGGGSAGLIAASGAAAIGARVALIEKNFLGGDCLNVGCVPSKALLRAAKVVGEIDRGRHLGIAVDGLSADFDAVMDQVRKARAEIAPHDSAQRYQKLGVDVYFGDAHFTGENMLQIDGQTVEFKRALIATGSRPASLPIIGLAEAGYLTNETLWNVKNQPEQLAIIGAGPVGVEMAQAFQRLGTQVTLFDFEPRILPREDATASALLADALLRDGVVLKLGSEIGRVSAENHGKRIEYEQDGEAHSMIVDEILVAAGRAPNVEGLKLENASVNFDDDGIVVDDHLRTSNPAIYAAGDVAMTHKYTHVAGHAGAIVVQNALFPAIKRKASSLIVPRVVYTDPEIAHVGLDSLAAAERGIAIDTYTQSFSGVDRAVTDSETEGIITVHVKRGSDKIVGATVVSRHAGELMSHITMAMKYNIGLSKIMMVVFPYPTQAEVLQKVAGQYNRTRLTPTLKRILDWWMAVTR
ncbi:MAG: mercuric reductase [Anaerolineae bacterium]|nr:mercuric reductase [Anaerolineae bacterium]